MSKFVFFLIFLFFSCQSYGQRMFQVNDASQNYKVTIIVAKCEGDDCSGEGKVILSSKNNPTFSQILYSEDLRFYLDKNNNPSSHMELYNEQSPLLFCDFNFDGTEDIAIVGCGNCGGYGAKEYSVYVYNSTKKKFVDSEELSGLCGNMGIFLVDKKRKRLISRNKDGCCLHYRDEYEVVPKKGLKLVVQEVDDVTEINKRKITTKLLVNGRWITNIRYEKFD